MFDPFDYMTKTPETILLGITHYDELLKWCDDPDNAYHLLCVYFDRDDVLEKILSKSAFFSYQYARDIIKTRFLLGEEAISKDAAYSYWYGRDIMKGRFVLGEEAISGDAYQSYKYARYALHDRFVLGEQTISEDAYYAFIYAKDVVKGKFPLGEDTIMNSEHKDEYLNLINQ